MRCAELERLIFEYLEDRLDHPVRQVFEAHVLGCQRCRQALSETVKSIALFRQLREVPCPEEIDKKIKYLLD